MPDFTASVYVRHQSIQYYYIHSPLDKIYSSVNFILSGFSISKRRF